MKTQQLTPCASNKNKALFIVAVSFFASLVLSMTTIGLAVNWILHKQ